MPTISELFNLSMEHIFITLTAVFFATIFSSLLAIVVFKKNFHVNAFLNVVSLLQSFPALGLFALLVPVMGIGAPTVIFALFLYALMPIFVNTIQGFKSINPEYYEIINSMNISKKDVLYKIEMPLVIPHIVSGIRVTTIFTIGLATIGTLVGAGGLGDVIYLGLQQLDISITIAGIIPLLIITLIANFLLNVLERKLTTPDVKASRRSNG